MSEMMGLIRRLSRPKHDSDAASDTPIDTPTSEPEVVAEGMQCGFKELWSGPEDKYGKFKWLDTKPDDLGKPAEDCQSRNHPFVHHSVTNSVQRNRRNGR